MNWTYIGGKIYTNRAMSHKILQYAVGLTTILPFTSSPGKDGWLGWLNKKPLVQMTDAINFNTLDDFDSFNHNNPKHLILCRQLANRLDIAVSMCFLNQTYADTFTGKINKFLDHGEMDRITHCKPYENTSYVGLASSEQMELLMKHPSWEFWHQYLKIPGSFIYRHEIGKTYNIRWVEVPQSWWPCPVVFGDKAVARWEIETPHLRANINDKTIAMWGDISFNKAWNPNESPRIVHLKPISRRFAMRIGTVEKYRQVVRDGIALLGEL